MIFYFSGTGNSLEAAKIIAKQNGDELISIAAAVNNGAEIYEYNLKNDETIGFIYPIYAWGPPTMVLNFIDRLKLENYKDNYTFSIASCGGSIGKTMEVIDSALKRKSMRLDSGFSVIMPNNYIIIGDVDSKEDAGTKLADAEEKLKRISRIVKDRKKGVFEVEKGFMPCVLTSVIYPLFNKNAVDTSKFYAEDSCTGCGICEKVCNCRNIKVEGKPQWGKQCLQCLACVHYCPVKAIQYGKSTEKKGRYTNPNVRLDEMYRD